jgi:DNA helicase-2/ATP-dependent DNA helicase PcrA
LTQYPEDRAAVLYRTNFQSRQIEEALRRYHRPYIVVGGFSFYQRAEVKDILAYLRVIQSPDDSISLQRIVNVPARGIGQTTLAQIEQLAGAKNLSFHAAMETMLEDRSLGARADSAIRAFRDLIAALRQVAAQGDVGETLRAIVERSGYQAMLKSDPSPDAETRLENIGELLNAAAESAERGESIADFLDHAALVADADQLDNTARISLLTMHNAKGLEFPIVFIAGMEEGLFPHQRSLIDENSMEEERRLCYVAMTRAEKRLTVSWARFRRRYGGGPAEPTLPSRFLKEIPGRLLERKGARSNYYDDEDGDRQSGVDLTPERFAVRETVKKNLYTGKTYNSVENVRGFFEQRGIQVPRPQVKLPQTPAEAPPWEIDPPQAPATAPAQAARPAVPPTPPQQRPPLPANRPPGSLAYGAPPKTKAPKKPGTEYLGAAVNHPKYGRGTVLRQEGEGEDAKLTVSFSGFGLKKILARFAGLKPEE